MTKHKCYKCEAIATWLYVPCNEFGENDLNDYWCDNCVSRGCSCNTIDLSGEEPEEYTDNQGRLLPCCEYWEDVDGWEINE